MEYTIAAFFLLHFFLHVYLFFGLKKSSRYAKDTSRTLPATVIVAARNEEKVIARCIGSLKKIEYSGQMEIILVNDKSTDRTKQIMLDETAGDERFKVIDSGNPSSGNLKGKANAIDSAIKISTGEIILTTDADCEVNPGWVSCLVSYYDEKTAMVNGFTNVSFSKSLFDKVQSLDWVYLLSLASSSSGNKKILSCVGNNVSFGKKVYEDLGGYSKIGFSVTEDLALMRAIDNINGAEIKYPLDAGTLVVTDPCENFYTLYTQKKRWLRGGADIRPLGYILGADLYAVNLFLVTGFLYTDIFFYIGMLLLKFVSELLLIIPVLKIFRMKSLLKYYIPFQIYFALYGLLTPLSFIAGKKIKWKGRDF